MNILKEALENITHDFKQLYEECYLQEIFYTDILAENDDNNIEKTKIINMIKSNQFWIRNHYKMFLNSLMSGKRASFLTPYNIDDFKEHNVQTFQLKGYPIGYALKPTENGGIDIISVHNNSNIRNIGDYLIESAKLNGGNMLDHFDGYLSDFYSKHGFNEYERYKWDDNYAPQNWDYEKYGRPDVILRKLTNK